MRQIKQSTARNIMVLMVLSSDRVTGATSKSLTITLSKDGGAFASIAPTVTERGSGWYNIALTASHTDTLHDLALHVTALGCDPVDLLVEVVGYDPDVANASAVDLTSLSSRIPASLVGGRMDSSVGAMSSNVVTAAAVAADAVTEIQAGLATSAEAAAIQADIASAQAAVQADIASVQADTDNIQTRLPAALIGGRMDASVGAMAAGVVTAAAVATNAIDADALAADAVGEIQAGLATNATLLEVSAKVDSLEAAALGRWEVTGNQLILYEMDGTTPLATFNLFDDTGTPSMTRIFERVPV